MGDPTKAPDKNLGMEVWAHGTRAELDLLGRHLAAMGLVVVPTTAKGDPDPTEPAPMPKGPRGRWRVYHRVHVRGDAR
ncbi:hypothetical protein ACIBF5_09620 [Micromonospora sp. NPDC050417]|uniref:hypothetical protein n=1 Tax=Micromonospora sp. NPDC050417 TaxID=3364280 RepID=UPI003789BA9B